MAVFGHVHRLPEEVPGRLALRLAVDTRTGRRPHYSPPWKCRPQHTRVRQVETNAVISAWDSAADCCKWGALRP